jgi:DNA-binding beta-propeller fold protein YncE
MKRWSMACIHMIFLTLVSVTDSAAQLVLSGNESKIDLTSGKPTAVDTDQPDSISLIDLSVFPPRVRHVMGISNSVIGPPSNVLVLPGAKRALIADSIVMDRTAKPDPWRPADRIHVMDLTLEPPRIIESLPTGRQPSGLSISPDGKLVLVANRADGSVTVLRVQGESISAAATVNVCEPHESASDVAISPDGTRALVSIQKGGYLRVLRISGSDVTATDQKASACGQPYRVVITPDGMLGLTAGQGFSASGLDTDCLTVVDLSVDPVRTTDFVPLGRVPESIEVSPDGKLLAAVLMEGSNFAQRHPEHTEHGQLVLLAREGNTFRVVQRQPIGRIPEGVAFAKSGHYLLVQCHPDRNIWVFEIKNGRAIDTGHRIEIPGLPSSLRSIDR